MTAIPLWLRIGAPILLLAALAIGLRLYVAHIDHTARAEQKAADTAAITLAQAEAKAADLAHARAVETANAAKKEAADNDLAPQLADARARLATYAARLRDQANQGGGGGTDMPRTADPAAIVDGPDQPAIVAYSDLDRCTENTVRLKNAQDWWKDMTK